MVLARVSSCSYFTGHHQQCKSLLPLDWCIVKVKTEKVNTENVTVTVLYVSGMVCVVASLLLVALTTMVVDYRTTRYCS